MRSLLHAAVAVGSLVLVGCGPQPPAGLSEADKAAIRRVLDSSVALDNAKEFAGASQVIFAEDAVFLPPNGPALNGLAAITSFTETYPPFSDFKVTQDLVDGRGDLAVAQGTYSMIMTMPGAAGPTKDEGKYMQIWRKQADGSWKVTREIFNSDLPAPAPPPAPAKK